MKVAKVSYPKETKIKQDFSVVKGTKNQIELVAVEDVYMKTLERKEINLGFKMEVPEGYNAVLIAKRSNFEKYGIMQADICLFDGKEQTSTEVLKYPVISFKDTVIPAGSSICSLMLIDKNDNITFDVN